MKIVVFGLTISSSWGNGHATLWRGLCRALVRRGHRVVFFERDVPYYATQRDLTEMRGLELVLYDRWEGARARDALRDADVAVVTSYCADGVDATDVVARSAAIKVFYDLDTPVTLDAVSRRHPLTYLGPRGLRDFDLVLSFTGGEALVQLRTRLGARHVVPLYGHVDPDVHRPAPPVAHYASDLSYLGTYAADRQETLEQLFLVPAARLPDRRFCIGGAQYPESFPWTPNIFFVRHLPPNEHPAFFSSSRITLNVTRRAMASMGYCPSGRLFEAAACGVPIVSDVWSGLEQFFTPGEEILIARDAADVVAALQCSDEQLQRIARAARERTLEEHTAERRALELELALANAGSAVDVHTPAMSPTDPSHWGEEPMEL